MSELYFNFKNKLFLFFFFLPLFFFSFIFISWRLITLQYCSGFCHTLIKEAFFKGSFSLHRREIAAYTYLLYSFPLTMLKFIWVLSSQEAATIKKQCRGPLLSRSKKGWSTKDHPTLTETPHDPDKTHLLPPFLRTLHCQLQIVTFHGHLTSIPLQGLSHMLLQLLTFNTLWRSSGWRAEMRLGAPGKPAGQVFR